MDFKWEWLPANGRFGSILLGINQEAFEITRFAHCGFFMGAEIIQKNNGFRWELLVVYSPANHSRSREFLLELHNKVTSSSLPIVIGGDFNLIRGAGDKSNQLVNNPRLVQSFNNWVAYFELIDLHHSGARFTWTNNQDNPVRECSTEYLCLVIAKRDSRGTL